MALNDHTLIAAYPLGSGIADLQDSYDGYSEHNMAFPEDGDLSGLPVADFNSSYYGIDNALQNGFDTEYSFSMWLKPDTIAGLQALMVNEQHGSYYNTWGVYLQADGQLQLFVRAVNQGGANYDIAYTGVSLVVDEWSHVVATWSGTEIKWYVNGEPASTTLASRVPYNSPATLWIGANKTKADKQYYDGKMSDLRFWYSELTEDDVAELHAAGQVPLDLGMVAKYDFDSGLTDDVGSYDLTAFSGADDSDGKLILPNINSGVYPNSRIPTGDQFTLSLWFEDLKDHSEAQSGWMMFDGTGVGSSAGLPGVANHYLAAIFTHDELEHELGAYYSPGTGGTWAGSGYSMTNISHSGRHHLVAAYDNGTLTYYIDGQQAGNAIQYPNNAGEIQVFGSWSGYSYAPAESLDEIRVYNRTLSSTEVEELYNNGANPQGENNMLKFKILGVEVTDAWPSEHKLSVWSDEEKQTLLFEGFVAENDDNPVVPEWTLTGIESLPGGAWIELEDSLDDGMFASNGNNAVQFSILDASDVEQFQGTVGSGTDPYDYMFSNSQHDKIEMKINSDADGFEFIRVPESGEPEAPPIYIIEPTSAPIWRFQMVDGTAQEKPEGLALDLASIGAVSTEYLRASGYSIVPKVELDSDSESKRIVNLMNFKDLRVQIEAATQAERDAALVARAAIESRVASAHTAAEAIIAGLESQLADSSQSLYWKPAIFPSIDYPGLTGEIAVMTEIMSVKGSPNEWTAGAAVFCGESDQLSDDTAFDVYVLVGYENEGLDPIVVRMEGLMERFEDLNTLEEEASDVLDEVQTARIQTREDQEASAAIVRTEISNLVSDLKTSFSSALFGPAMTENRRRQVTTTVEDMSSNTGGLDLVLLGLISPPEAAAISKIEVYVEGVRHEDLVTVSNLGVASITAPNYLQQIPTARVAMDIFFKLEELYAIPEAGN